MKNNKETISTITFLVAITLTISGIYAVGLYLTKYFSFENASLLYSGLIIGGLGLFFGGIWFGIKEQKEVFYKVATVSHVLFIFVVVIFTVFAKRSYVVKAYTIQQERMEKEYIEHLKVNSHTIESVVLAGKEGGIQLTITVNGNTNGIYYIENVIESDDSIFYKTSEQITLKVGSQSLNRYIEYNELFKDCYNSKLLGTSVCDNQSTNQHPFLLSTNIKVRGENISATKNTEFYLTTNKTEDNTIFVSELKMQNTKGK